MKITLRIERKDGRYYEKELTEEIIAGLYDLQFMMGRPTWETVKLNKMDGDMNNFFKIIEYMSEVMYQVKYEDDKKYAKKIDNLKGSYTTDPTSVRPRWRMQK